MQAFSDIFLQALLFIYNTIGFHNLGVAIIEIAIISRLVFWPFAKQQAGYTKKMNEIQPHLAALKEKHKGNQQAFASAQMELFKQHGVNPAAGCLPAVVQIVILFGLLGGLNCAFDPVAHHCINPVLNLNTKFLMWNLAKPDAHHLLSLPFALPGVLVVLAAVTQFIQTKMMMPVPVSVKKDDKPKEKEEKKEFMQEFAEAQSSMIWMFPLIFLFLGTQWPSGLALYWTTSSVIAIFQTYRITGLGALGPDVIKLKKLINRN